MTNDDITLASDQIRISVEIGADYAMSETLASLLQQVQAEVSDDDVSGYGIDFLKLGPPTGERYYRYELTNVRIAGYVENDSKGKKKGN